MADFRHIRHSTYFALLAEFGTSEIPLDELAPKYFGLRATEARKQAATYRLPVTAYRLKGQKSPWLVSAASLAEVIDETRERAEENRRHDLARLSAEEHSEQGANGPSGTVPRVRRRRPISG